MIYEKRQDEELEGEYQSRRKRRNTTQSFSTSINPNSSRIGKVNPPAVGLSRASTTPDWLPGFPEWGKVDAIIVIAIVVIAVIPGH